MTQTMTQTETRVNPQVGTAFVAKIPEFQHPTQKCREHTAWAVGDVAEQGDILFVAVPGVAVRQLELTDRQDMQLAFGDTKGSRHIVSNADVFETNKAKLLSVIKTSVPCFEMNPEDADEFIGAVFFPKNGGAVVTHPQHDYQAFPKTGEPGTFDEVATVVLFQKNQDLVDMKARRARD